MKTVKFLALAAILMVFSLALPASAKTGKEQKKKVAVTDPVVLAGKTLQPGNYQVEWQGNGPAVKVKFLKYGKTVLTAPAKVAQLHQKAPYDAVVENTRKNGANTISEIEWSNQREALMFGHGHAANIHRTHKRAS